MFTCFLMVIATGIILSEQQIPNIWLIPVYIIGLILLIIPVEGFMGRNCIAETELIPLRCASYKDKDKTYYVYKCGKYYTFAYDNSEEFDLCGDAYEEKRVTGKVKVYESRECKKPLLKEFKNKPMRGFITFAPFSTKREYVFYIPKDTMY